jgi:hypothetical protein
MKTADDYFQRASGFYLSEQLSLEKLEYTNVSQIAWQPFEYWDEKDILQNIWQLAEAFAQEVNEAIEENGL